MIPRDHEGGADRPFNDYFSPNPVYPEHIFRRRFRLGRDLFVKIVNVVEQRCDYFKQRKDVAQQLGLSPLQKCTAAIRMLAYGSPTDILDEYIQIGESTTIEC
ncbi:uncharacterized protein LOC130589834 [Beta vulgaris subsp. vulgaris]|uniref:uncharacterized protein LOC130589834 n=1 Tax=Beta vulgaris subsp. vulgaris TaxID=3555 RepID=UPI002546FDF1|nr:uncharacterized protein LOC130589834 [Beta vulgaris subsp. vulgaris]